MPNNRQNSKWPLLLAQAITKNGLALIFVILILVVFRMPQLSDLTVVIIQLKGLQNWLVMLCFFGAIYVMALLISYGNLFKFRYKPPPAPTPKVKTFAATDTDGSSPDSEDEDLEPETSEQPSQFTRAKERFYAFTNAVSFKDPEEERLEELELMEASETKDGEGPRVNIKFHSSDGPKPSGDDGNSSTGTTGVPPQLPGLARTTNYVELVYPKLLAIFMMLGVAFSVDNTYHELFNAHIVPSITFLVLTIGLIVFSHPGVGDYLSKTFWKKKRDGSIPIILIGISVAIIILLGVLNEYGTQADIRNFFWSLICLTAIFTLFSLTYNKKIRELKNAIAVPAALILIVIILGIYVVIFFDPRLHSLKWLTPMVIVLVCLIGVFTIFLLLKYLGRRWHFPLLGAVVIVFMAFAFFNAKNDNFSHYEVSNVSSSIDPDDRMNLDAYVDQWIAERYDKIMAATEDKPFPIVMVSAEGGGSRAGHWALLVHSYLSLQNKDYYKTHLFSMTGASGGSVGSNIFYALAHKNRDVSDKTFFRSKGKEGFAYAASDFYHEDYISSSIAGLLGRDLMASIFGVNGMDDRGDITEDEWEAQFKDVFNDSLLARPYLDIMPKAGAEFTPPLMVTNTTHVQSGRLYIMSPVKFEPNTDNAWRFRDLLSDYKDCHTGKMIKRSSAMLLTARFPYLSPNGRIKGVGQFGDGGYYDNIGGIVTIRLERALIEGLDRQDSLKDKYRIKHLIIRNNPGSTEGECDECQCPDDTIDYESQLVTPAKMLLSATFAPPDEFVDSYPEDYRVESKRTLIPIDRKTKSNDKCDTLYKPLIPLGRYMSKEALKSLEARLLDPEVKDKLDKVLTFNKTG